MWEGVEESGRALRDTPPFAKARRMGHPDCAAAAEKQILRLRRRMTSSTCCVATGSTVLRSLLALFAGADEVGYGVVETVKRIFVYVDHVAGFEELVADVLLERVGHGEVFHLVLGAEVEGAEVEVAAH